MPILVCALLVYVQLGFELTKMTDNSVSFSSPSESRFKLAANWITSVISCDTKLYIGDSSGQLTEMDFVAIRNQKKVRQSKVLIYAVVYF